MLFMQVPTSADVTNIRPCVMHGVCPVLCRSGGSVYTKLYCTELKLHDGMVNVGPRKLLLEALLE